MYAHPCTLAHARISEHPSVYIKMETNLSDHSVGVPQKQQVEGILLTIGLMHGQVLQVDVLVRVLHQAHLPKHRQ